MKAEAVIPSKRDGEVSIPYDIDIYKHSNHLEHFRRLATRYGRRTSRFPGIVRLSAAMASLR